MTDLDHLLSVLSLMHKKTRCWRKKVEIEGRIPLAPICGRKMHARDDPSLIKSKREDREDEENV
jgi:hypothetical protein